MRSLICRGSAVLAPALPDWKLKAEAFLGKMGAEVKGFTSAVKIYER